MENITIITAIVGASTGSGGLVLGILNYFHQRRQIKPRLSVVPKLAFKTPNGMISCEERNQEMEGMLSCCPVFLCWEVVNLGSVDVTLDEVGFRQSGNKRGVLMSPLFIIPQESRMPIHLAPRKAVHIYGEWTSLTADMKNATAYVKTACRHEFRGTSPVVRNHIRALQARGGRQ